MRAMISCAVFATLMVGMAPSAQAAAPGLDPGERIVYVSTAEVPDGEIHVATATSDTRLTNNTDSDGYPQWSPDGRMIAFYSDRTGNAEVYVMTADGSDVTNLTDNPASDYGAAWSPDGTKILFNSGRTGDAEVFVMDADGSNQVNLTKQPGSNEWAPDWSPDGTKILFISNRDGNDEIYVMNADGSDQTNLSNNPGGDYGPRWSPDGSTVSFQSNRDGDFEVFTMGADGSSPTNLTDNSVDDYGATWSPDGLQLAYNTDAADGSDIWTMNANGTNPQPLITGNGSQALPDWGITPPRFKDVGFDHNFYTDITWLANLGITKGCNPPANDMYCPDADVTRGQMAAFLVRALGYTDDGEGGTFSDADGSVFEQDIDRLAAAGVTKGCNPPVNDMYCPLDAVTRGQMAAFLHRALDLVLTPGAPVTFVDDDDSVFEVDIEWLGATGVTRGCNPPTNDMYCPLDAVTRGQMAAFLHRALG